MKFIKLHSIGNKIVHVNVEHMLKIKYYGHKTQVEINYCPMYGRKLEEVNADEKENI